MRFNPSSSVGAGRKPLLQRRMPIPDVASALRGDAEDASIALLGEPNRQLSNRRELRWGNKGALRVHIGGKLMGRWVDESGGDPDRGDMLALAVRERGGMDAAYEWARRWCGDKGDGAPSGSTPANTRADPAQAAARAAEQAADAEGRCARAEALYEAGQPVAGTQAEAYLRARCVTIPDGAPLRFHPSVIEGKSKKEYPAMVAEVSVPDGTFCAVHRTFLDREGRSKKADFSDSKKLLGSPGEGAIWLTGPSERMVIGEGIETTLSAWQADPSYGAVAATNANFARVALPDSIKEIVLLVDVDAPHPKTGKRAGEEAARKAAQVWVAQGRTVRLAFPSDREGKKYDFNDLLREGGLDAVRKALAGAEIVVSDAAAKLREFSTAAVAKALSVPPRLPFGVREGVPPIPRVEPVALDAAQAMVADLVRAQVWAGALWVRPDVKGKQKQAKRAAALSAAGFQPGPMPKPLVIRLTAGGGKTETAIRVLADLFGVWPGGIPLQVAVLVPDHELAAALAVRLRGAGLPCVHLLGRGRRDADGNPMCLRNDMAEEVRKQGKSVHATMCDRPGQSPCPARQTCGYFGQVRNLPDRCIVIGTHHALATGYLPGMVKLPDLVIVDEDARRALRREPMYRRLDDLREIADRWGARWGDSLPAVRVVLDLLELPRAAVGDWRGHLTAQGVSLVRLASVAEAVRDSMDRHTGTPDDEGAIRFGLAMGGKNIALPVLVELLDALVLDWRHEREALQSVTLEEWQDNDGRTHLSVCVIPALPMIEGRAVLALDASADKLGSRALYGDDVRFETIEVERQAVIVQIVTPSFSKRALGFGERVSADDKERGGKLIHDLRRAIELLVSRHGAGNVGAAMPRELRILLTGEDNPTGVTEWHGVLIGHFGALRGLNDMERCEAVLVVGRPMPTRLDVERIARGDYARDRGPLGGLAVWGPGEPPPEFESAARGFLMADGRHLGKGVSCHPEPRVDAVLRQICDEDVIQAIDRVRLVRADGAAPKTVYLLSPVVVPLTVDEVCDFDGWLCGLELAHAGAETGAVVMNREGMPPQSLTGRGGELLGERQQRTIAERERDRYIANSHRFRTRGRGRRNLLHKKKRTHEGDTAAPPMVCGIISDDGQKIPEVVSVFNDVEPTPAVLSAILGRVVRAVEVIGWNPADEAKAGNLGLFKEVKVKADAHTYAKRQQGETDADYNTRLRVIEDDFKLARDAWLASMNPSHAVKLRESDAAARVKTLTQTGKILGGLAFDDAKAALDVLDGFVQVMPDGTLCLAGPVPKQEVVNLWQSIDLMAEVRRSLTYELASRPYIRFLIQEDDGIGITDGALARRLGVPVSLPLRAA